MRRLILALFVSLAAAVGPVATAGAEPGGPFMLRSHEGQIVRDDFFAGRLMLIYFGYTFCPDVCPTALSNVAGAMDALGEDAAMVQPLFITVDPERDTVPVLRDYVTAFHPSIIGLTGPVEFVEAAMRKYDVRAEKVPFEDADTYLVDHTSSVFVMGPNGEYLERLPHTMPAEEMAEHLRKHIDRMK